MTPEPTLLQYAAALQGQRLIAREEAAVPFFWLTLDVIMQERSQLGPVERFALQAVASGLSDPSDLAGFLGLERASLDRTLVDLWQADLVDLTPDAKIGRIVRLTEPGRKAAAEASTLKIEVAELPLAFDRLLWQPSPLTRHRLLRPRDARAAGLRQLDYARGKQPVAADVPLEVVRQALELGGVLSSDPNARTRELIAVRAVKGTESMYWPADLLAYAPLGASDSHLDVEEIELAIGEAGHLSRAHSIAFASTPQHSRIARDLALPPPAAAADLPPNVAAQAVPLGKILVLQNELASTENALTASERQVEDDESESANARSSIRELEQQRDALLEQLDNIPVRQLQTWELADVLREARYGARRRLLIISPWVNREVVDQEFIQSLGNLVSRGVMVHIGYGYPDREADKNDPRALRDLALLADRAAGRLVLRKIGTTHEKVLIYDDSIVTGSFNWLSFRGDRQRALRRESGTLVQVPTFVAAQYQQFVAVVEGRDDAGTEVDIDG